MEQNLQVIRMTCNCTYKRFFVSFFILVEITNHSLLNGVNGSTILCINTDTNDKKHKNVS